MSYKTKKTDKKDVGAGFVRFCEWLHQYYPRATGFFKTAYNIPRATMYQICENDKGRWFYVRKSLPIVEKMLNSKVEHNSEYVHANLKWQLFVRYGYDLTCIHDDLDLRLARKVRRRRNLWGFSLKDDFERFDRALYEKEAASKWSK